MVKYFEGKDPYALEYSINDYINQNPDIIVVSMSYQIATREFENIYTSLILFKRRPMKRDS